MFSQPIVFVVGAGASSEFGLPTGADLKQRIATSLNFRPGPSGRVVGDGVLHEMLYRKFGDQIEKYQAAAGALSAIIGQFISIDEALHWYSSSSEIVSLGKASIVREILQAERVSPLFSHDHPDSKSGIAANNNWTPTLLSMAVSSLRRGEVQNAFSQVTVINFNYDRTIEQFLYIDLQTKFGFDVSDAKRVVMDLNILRPYGSVGALPWQDKSGVPYGANLGKDHDQLFRLSENVRIYTEDNRSAQVIDAIHTAIDTARMIVFLGFGFHQQNMNLLKVGRGADWRRVLATVLGIDSENYKDMARLIATTVGGHPDRTQLLPRTCWHLLLSMQPSLTAGL
jgi:hypothetical protein